MPKNQSASSASLRLPKNFFLNDTYGMSQRQATYAIRKKLDKEKLMSYVRALIFRRLKYATGGLLESLSVEVKAVGNDITIAIVCADPDKFQALLGEEETSAGVPTIGELVSWIRGKAKVFNYQINQINQKHRDTYREAMARQRKKNIIGGFRDTQDRFMGLKKTETGGYTLVGYKDIAETIQERMISKYKNTGSSILGSRYTFLGFEKAKKSKMDFRPVYKTYSTTLREELEDLLVRYVDLIFGSGRLEKDTIAPINQYTETINEIRSGYDKLIEYIDINWSNVNRRDRKATYTEYRKILALGSDLMLNNLLQSQKQVTEQIQSMKRVLSVKLSRFGIGG